MSGQLSPNSLEWKKMVDEMWDFAIEKDHELKESMECCEIKATELGMSFYEYIWYITVKQEAPTLAKEWVRTI